MLHPLCASLLDVARDRFCAGSLGHNWPVLALSLSRQTSAPTRALDPLPSIETVRYLDT
jgi:hypothetical protein